MGEEQDPHADEGCEHRAGGGGDGHDVDEALLERVRETGLLPEDRPVVVLLSGGRDSVCLLDVAVRICGAGSDSGSDDDAGAGAGIGAVHALHVNYGLREAAAEDERHCSALCEKLGVPLQVVSVERSQARGGNLQAWAREVRYGAAEALAERLDGLVAAGHTASDQVETVLYRLAASPGRRALLGMASAEGRLIRPLLCLTREQTAAYCRARGLAWREDESNLSDRYARNRVRHGVLPQLRAVHPAAESNVLRTAKLLREETELLEGLIEAELAEEDEIELRRLAELPPALARLIVVRLAERAGGGYVPQAGDRVAELLRLGERSGSAELHIGGNVGAVLRRGRLTMRRLPPRAQRLQGDHE